MSLSRPLRLSSRTESPATMNGEAERTLLTVAEEYDDLTTDLESVAVDPCTPNGNGSTARVNPHWRNPY